MDNIEIPEYFICPISLQIMKDPVTGVTGITYDRESIEHWLFKTHNTICPVSKQPLPRDSDLTPNHTLRRLIQAWCTLNAVERIPTPKSPLNKLYVLKLIQDLRRGPNGHQLKTLQKLESLAVENDRNKVYMVEVGLGNGIISFVVSCYKNKEQNGLEEALSLFHLVRRSIIRSPGIFSEKEEIMESLIWVLGNSVRDRNPVLKSQAAYAMKVVVQKSNPNMLERLEPEFFRRIISHLREDANGFISQQATNSLLHLLLEACPWGRNRMMMVEAEAVFDLIEVELRSPEKKTTELILEILYHLCSCAEGRAQLLNHAAGIAVVTRRILNVSAAAADERAVLILWQIGRYSGTNGVVQEMMRVGTVAKLCMVMQADCGSHVKEKAREILRMHFDVWRDSPCIELATLSRYTR